MGTDRISNDTGKPHYMVKYSPIHRCKPHITKKTKKPQEVGLWVVFFFFVVKVHSKYDIL